VLAPLIHYSDDGEVREYVHQVVKRLRVELSREQVAGPLHAIPHARPPLRYMLHNEDTWRVRASREQGIPHSFKLAVIGNRPSKAKDRITLPLHCC